MTIKKLFHQSDECCRRDFVAGDEFSLGDIPTGIMAHWWYSMPIDHGELPNIKAWYARLCERPAFQQQVLR